MLKLKGFLTREANEIIGIGSTDSPDRDGEIIKQDGWDLTNFLKNPVLLTSHAYHEFPIGRITDVMIENGQLKFKAVFSEATQEAREAYQLVKEGILSAFSVGFIPKEYDPADTSVITKAELLEISLVTVPANPQAVVLAKSFKGNELAKVLVKEWLKDEILKGEVEKIETETIDVKEGSEIHCECGKNYILKITTHSEEENKGEEGKGRKELEVSDLILKRTVGHLQKILEARNGRSRKEDRK
jgi:HK97 family phage prohead protease